MRTEAYLAIPSKAKLIIFEEQSLRQVALDYKNEWYLGRRTPQNNPDIELMSPIASRQHGRFVHVDQEWYYLDMGSYNGTYYNGTMIETDREGRRVAKRLSNGDVLRIDAGNLNTPDGRGVWIMFSTEQMSDCWRTLALRNQTVWSIGRSPENDIVINRPYISAKHAELYCVNGEFCIADCNSTSGTWVNGMQIQSAVRLKEKDRISLCNWNGVLIGNYLLYNDVEMRAVSNLGSKVAIRANIASKKVPNMNGHGLKELIRDVNLEVKEGNLVALLGGSGAGKTTVMNCLNGMETSGVEGQIYFYGEDLMANFARLKVVIGSVPQENVFREMLTVEEELMQAAMLKLPPDTSRKEMKQRVAQVLEQLNLTSKRKTVIRKCSGGEQKRVNIAKELVSDKLLLCLDEPDAGLDPFSKKELFTILQSLAHDSGKSILVIIHDVSDIDMFDQVIMMVKVDDVGRLAFSGSPQEAYDYFGTSMKEAYQLIAKDPMKYIQRN